MTDLLPGNTILPIEEKEETSLTSLSLSVDRPTIILASNDVNDQSLFLNGLTQNILILYHLFESLGYCVYLLQHGSNSSSEKRTFLNSYRTISTQELIMKPRNIKALIEIGMSLDAISRNYLRSIGATIVKLYLGNILNIDIETIQNCKSIFFHHHIVGEIDEIWTSPHYQQHIDYAALLNRTELDHGRVVPYVWDPCFLTQYGTKETLEWVPPSSWEQTDVVIMDPNISFQKCFFYPLLLLEAYSKKHPEWKGKIHVINGDRIKMSGNAHHTFLSSLSLFHASRIILYPRKTIHTALKEHRSACFFTHQWNNEYNYMTLELLYCNYPILHNSEGWSPYGYYYSINQWEKAIEQVHRAISAHQVNRYIYQTHAAQLIWKHSVHHPRIQERWRAILADI